MATVKSVMEVMRRLRPTFKNGHDKLAFAVHAAFLTSGFTLIAIGRHGSRRTGICDDTDYYNEVGIEGWNENGECYTFVYMCPGIRWHKTLVKSSVMGDLLMVITLNLVNDDAFRFDLNVDDYVVDTQSSNYSEQFKNLKKLLKSFDREILSHFSNWNILRRKLLVSLVGVDNAGKTSLLRTFRSSYVYGSYRPTQGYDFEELHSYDVPIKIWDLAGRPSFRRLWEKYCQTVHAIIYVVDAACPKKLSISRSVLHDLLSKQSLSGIPLLVIGNKIDQESAISEEDLTDQMNLRSIRGREVGCFMVSCKEEKNINSVIDWLLRHAEQLPE